MVGAAKAEYENYQKVKARGPRDPRLPKVAGQTARPRHVIGWRFTHETRTQIVWKKILRNFSLLPGPTSQMYPFSFHDSMIPPTQSYASY